MLNARILGKSVAQGLGIFAASFGGYLFARWQNPIDTSLARSIGLAVIMLSNLLLVLVNASDEDSVLRSIARLKKDGVMWAVNGASLLLLFVILYTPINGFLKLAPLSIAQFLAALGLAAASVLWMEAVKLIRRRHKRRIRNEP